MERDDEVETDNLINLNFYLKKVCQISPNAKIQIRTNPSNYNSNG